MVVFRLKDMGYLITVAGTVSDFHRLASPCYKAKHIIGTNKFIDNEYLKRINFWDLTL